MGTIRKQTILSSLLVYVGFLIGAVNLYFYTRVGYQHGGFTAEQFGLTRIFFDFAQNMYALGSLGVIPVIYKFYPYYKDNLEESRIDLMTWSMLTAMLGFMLVCIIGVIARPFFVAHYLGRSSLLIIYYYWIFPFALGMLLFSVLEGFCWGIQKTVISNFLKETALRLITLGFILLFYFNIISFSLFIKLFAFLYLIIFLILLIFLFQSKQLHFPGQVSLVTKKFRKKMVGMQSLIFGGTIIASVAATIDSFMIAKFQGLAMVAVFGLAQYAANLIQVPQRSIQSIAAGVLSRAWKEKNMREIDRIYRRSCINLLLIALIIFGNLWLNVHQGMQLLHIQKEYEAGMSIIFILGMVRIIDAGTGLNNVIINTSNHWKFDFYSGIILLALRLPLSYFLIMHYGIIGSAFAELTAFGIYNFIRFEFLRRKFRLQPFHQKTLMGLLAACLSYLSCYYLLGTMSGWTGMLIRTFSYTALMVGSLFLFRLSPDTIQLWDQFKKNNPRYLN